MYPADWDYENPEAEMATEDRDEAISDLATMKARAEKFARQRDTAVEALLKIMFYFRSSDIDGAFNVATEALASLTETESED